MKKIYINQLSERMMRDREMNSLRGGQYCSCSCIGDDNPIEGNANGNYNLGDGGSSRQGCNQHIVVDGQLTYGAINTEVIVEP